MLSMSIVTVVRNNETTIADCISSVAGQSLPPFEHIIIDGKSTDGTLSEIKKHQHSAVKLVSESDKGIYDAMNKGILLATGDIIGILNSDDIYAHSQVLENVTKLFQESCADALFADLV
jgi:glycosyltransferase involved in cell wall biosynthesis